MRDLAKDIVAFWLEEVGADSWYRPCSDLRKTAKDRFQEAWEEAKSGEFCAWMCTPEHCLALVILLDQMPRLMFHGTQKAYASDEAALAAAKRGIVLGHDLKLSEPERQFLYTPLMHSESLTDQERCVRLMSLRLLNSGQQSLVHAKAHRDVIRQFGRFPHRNQALGRDSTGSELAYITAGGYDFTVNMLAA